MDPHLLAEFAYNTSKSASEVLLDSLLGGTDLNCIAQKGGVYRESADGCKTRYFLETEVLTRKKDLVDGAGLNCLRWEM